MPRPENTFPGPHVRDLSVRVCEVCAWSEGGSGWGARNCVWTRERKRLWQKRELAYWEKIKRLSWGSPSCGTGFAHLPGSFRTTLSITTYTYASLFFHCIPSILLSWHLYKQTKIKTRFVVYMVSLQCLWEPRFVLLHSQIMFWGWITV